MAPRAPAFADTLADRQVEVALLRAVLAGAAEGRSAVVAVEGPPGIGRTALTACADAVASEAGIRVVHATGASSEVETPLGVVAQLMAPLLPADSPQWTALRSGAGPSALGQLIREFLSAARQRPLLAIVDDAQWVDAESLRWLQGVARRMTGTRLILLLTSRTGSDVDVTATHQLRLAPLEPAAVRAVLDREFPDGVGEEFASIAAEGTRGNPAVLRAVLGRLSAQRVLPADRSIPQLREAIAEAASDMVSRTIDGLPAELVLLLRAIAICAGVLDFDLVCTVAGLQSWSAPRARSVLHNAGLITTGVRPRLAAWVSPDRLLAGMPVAQRESMHAHAARLGHLSAAEDTGVATILLGTKAIGEPWVVDVLRRAAAWHNLAGDATSATRLLSRATRETADPLAHAKVLVELGEIELLESPEAADRHLGQVVVADSGPEIGPLRVRAADLLFCRGAGMLVRRLTSEAYRSRRADGESADRLVAVHWLAEDDAAMPISLDGPPELAEWPEDPVQAGVAAWHLAMAGRDIERCKTLARKAIAIDGPAGARTCAAWALAVADELDEAAAALRALLGDLRLPADRVLAAYAWSCASDLAARRFDLDAAERALATSLELLPLERWHPRVSPSLVAAQVLMALGRGEFDTAQRIARSHPAPTGLPDGMTWPHLLYAHGQLRLAAGDHEQAAGMMLECGRQLQAKQADNPALISWRAPAVIALRALGRSEQAENLLAAEHRLAKTWGAPSVIARVEQLRRD
ncbi:AAA family ATPase [Kutzneria buriramensis]|uniref:AAA ATPase-like protein n=1 Tax=Kutzneria buriramensis TaxID=1045776 RepID=A0A3E0I5R7_9PSEU|nr:AAA family ATPase [Kutzneria buriramensis]REH53941.1 AAA ATPase-like protein [Kutzneria buriramensis]